MGKTTVTVLKPKSNDSILRDTDDVLESMRRSDLIKSVLGVDSGVDSASDSDELGIDADNLKVLQRFMSEFISARQIGDTGSMRESATMLRDGMLYSGLSNPEVKNMVQELKLPFELEPSIEDHMESWKSTFDEQIKGLRTFDQSMMHTI